MVVAWRAESVEDRLLFPFAARIRRSMQPEVSESEEKDRNSKDIVKLSEDDIEVATKKDKSLSVLEVATKKDKSLSVLDDRTKIQTFYGELVNDDGLKALNLREGAEEENV